MKIIIDFVSIVLYFLTLRFLYDYNQELLDRDVAEVVCDEV